MRLFCAADPDKRSAVLSNRCPGVTDQHRPTTTISVQCVSTTGAACGRPPECFFDSPLGSLVLTLDALRVYLQPRSHAMAGPLGDLRRRNAAVEPSRDCSVTQVIRPPRQRRLVHRRGEHHTPSPTPGPGVSDRRQHSPTLTVKHPLVGVSCEPRQVRLKQPGQVRRAQYRPEIWKRLSGQLPLAGWA